MPPTRTIDLLGPEYDGRRGVLSNQHVSTLIDAGVVVSSDGSAVPSANVQPASLDLRLGSVAYPLQCSFLPGRDRVEKRMEKLILRHAVDISGEGGFLERNRPYLIPLKERLTLPADMRAKANPKSSTGRADVFTRVITDHSYFFDEVAPGYRGTLYLEVVPLSFSVWVKEDLTLNQLRFFLGHPELSDAEVVDMHEQIPLLYEDGMPTVPERLVVSNGLLLGVNLQSSDVYTKQGYMARSAPPLLDLTRVREAPVDKYWERIRVEERDRVILESKRFYLLMSQEAVRIPPHLAAEMTAYDPTNGELRTHYAGFFDPGFGYDPAGHFHGATAALEVRAHDVDFMIEHGQRVCRLTFERMLEEPSMLYGQGIGSNYQRQSETLGKHFRLPGKADRQGPDQLPLFASERERA